MKNLNAYLHSRGFKERHPHLEPLVDAVTGERIVGISCMAFYGISNLEKLNELNDNHALDRVKSTLL